MTAGLVEVALESFQDIEAAHQSGFGCGNGGAVGSRAAAADEQQQRLGIDRLAMIVCGQGPWPPYDLHLRAMRPLKEVVWSIVDSGGKTGWAHGKEAETLVELAGRFPNITGAYMDDFFRDPAKSGQAAVHGVESLRRIREKLALPDRRLDLWAVLYAHQLDLPIREHLPLIDIVSFWTWHARELECLEENLARLEELTPDGRRSLGLYLWDYSERRPMPLELMMHQCEVALNWLKAGRVESLMFLGSYLCDLDLAAVEWTREWIRNVGRTPVGGLAGP